MSIWLIAASAATMAAGGAEAAPGDQRGERQLDEDIVVTGQRPSFKTEVVQVGAFRNQSVLDTPATVAVIPRALLDAQGAIGLEEALRNTPGVTQQATSPTTSNNFVSRGVLMNARTNYRLNGGLQVINLSPVPIENKQRVELLKGVSALYYGISTPSGIVNVVTKRAGTQPVNTLTINGDAEGSVGAGVDFGRKIGAEGQFGVRLNAYGSHIETPINGVNGYRYLASGAFDWQVSDRLALKLDVEHYRRATDEPGGISLAAFQLLKTVPDPHARYAPVNAPYRTWSTNVLGRADYAIAGDWSVRVESGLATSRRQRARADFSFTSAATVASGAGRIAGNYTPDQSYRNEYLRGEVAGSVETLGIRHELLLGAARNRQVQDDQHQQSYTSAAQNFYVAPSYSFDTLTFTTTRLAAGSVNIDTGFYVLDTAHVGERLLLIGGVRRVLYDTENLDGSGRYRMTAWTPTGGVVFKPTPRSSLYFTYIEGLESAGTAPDGTTNQGEIMPPVISRQYEAGARVEVLGALASLAWFHIDRGLSYTDLSGGSPGTYVTNGRAVHQGVEASVQGRLTRTVSVSLAGQYLRAVQRETGSAAQDGKWVDNTPRWSGSAFVEYRPAALPALGVSAGLFYTGKRYADAQNLYVMPAYTTYSLGADYKLRLPQGRALTLRVNGDNITNTRYWATGGSVFYVGLARQVRFSASMDF
ncbi:MULTISPECIES: TonB-dependent siderophore receptor [unclassified Novosphingobium]|uniref:TonB-dependent receptor n=1 Tax=unclassified Novosphingobium TaxID=2644732 RepID=UPI00146CF9ED|nr:MULTISPECIES: TonB-dependent siderophore receptor [unclassified Novosphingobium]NMN04556.1 iron complex outermembrane receptor protein [Novosphingobium sp. SG919]NMN85451.1 iron complex outermembrane receptor protein [Novosphingobium sp. SG916]